MVWMVLPFVTGAFWHRSRDVTVHVRVQGEAPEEIVRRPGSGGGKSTNDSKDAAARLLTSKIKQAKSAAELLDLLDGAVDGPIFNYFHASAAYHQPGNRSGKVASQQVTGRVRCCQGWQQEWKICALKGQLQLRAAANIFWSLGQLSDALDVSKGLLMALLESMSEEASWVNPRDLANNLLACVQVERSGTRSVDCASRTCCTDFHEGKVHDWSGSLQLIVGICSFGGRCVP